jgi:predicted small secreted protein
MIQKHKRTILLLLATAVFAGLSTSCATMRGLGEDVSGAGRGLQKAASS